ncbi:MAG: transcription antitermination factor NusB [Pseudomonadota bacterium]
MGLRDGRGPQAQGGRASQRQRSRTRSKPIAGTHARAAALDVILAVTEARVPLSSALPDLPNLSDPRDAALARAVVRTTVRRLGDVDWALATLMAKKLPKRASRVRAILRLSAAQLLFMRQADHAAVNVAVALLKAEAETGGFAALANAVLRRLIRERDEILERLPDDANTPAWLYQRWQKHYGAAAAAGMAAIHRSEPPLDLCLKSGTQLPDGAAPLPGGGGRIDGAVSVETLPGYTAGDWWVQDFAAQRPAQLLGDVSGKHVLDLCAAPGGKTMQLAAGGAKVTAVEVDGARAERLAENLARTKLSGAAEIVVADALNVEGTFDAVLLDAPCSATGTLRRQPDVAHSKSPQDIASLAKVQRALLTHASQLVRTGGRLVYATCSLEPEEGEEQLNFIKAEIPSLRLEPIDDEPALSFATEEGALRTLPHQALPGGGGLQGLDGFFAARFVKHDRKA